MLRKFDLTAEFGWSRWKSHRAFDYHMSTLESGPRKRKRGWPSWKMCEFQMEIKGNWPALIANKVVVQWQPTDTWWHLISSFLLKQKTTKHCVLVVKFKSIRSIPLNKAISMLVFPSSWSSVTQAEKYFRRNKLNFKINSFHWNSDNFIAIYKKQTAQQI